MGKKTKNIKTEAMGKVRANIHLGKQLFDNIHTVHHGKAKDKKLRADLAAQAKEGQDRCCTGRGRRRGLDVVGIAASFGVAPLRARVIIVKRVLLPCLSSLFV